MGIASALNKKKQGVIKGDASWNHGHEIPPNISRVKRCKKLSAAVGAKSKQHRLTNGHPVTYFSSLLPSFPLFPLLFSPHHSSPLRSLYFLPSGWKHVRGARLVWHAFFFHSKDTSSKKRSWRQFYSLLSCGARGHTISVTSPTNVFHEPIYIGTLAFALYVLINGSGRIDFRSGGPRPRGRNTCRQRLREIYWDFQRWKVTQGITNPF